MVIPFMTIYLTQSLHFSIGDAGWVMAMFGVGSILGTYAGGKLTDAIGFYPVQFWSLVMNGVMFLVLGQMRQLWSFAVCVFIMALVGDSFRPANSAATAFYSSPENRTRSYSLNRLAVNLGFTLGPTIGGILASISYGWLFWADGCTCLAAAVVLRLLLKPVAHSRSAKADHLAEPVVKTSAYRDKAYLRFLVFTGVYAVCFFQLVSMVPVFYKEVGHLSEWTIGLVLGMNGGIIALTEMVIVYKLEGRRPNVRYISWGVFLTSMGFLCFNVLGSSLGVIVFSMVLFTVGEMLSMPFMNSYWISRSGMHNRGEYAALYAIAFSAAQVVSPTLGAQAVGHWGYRVLWYLVAGVALVACYGFRRLVK